MRNFSIQWINDYTRNDSICLAFSGNAGDCLHVKNIRFFTSGETKADTGEESLHLVTIGSTATLQHFRLPAPDKVYTEMKFEVAQKGQKGWLVTIDLTSHYPDIQEAPYQVL